MKSFGWFIHFGWGRQRRVFLMSVAASESQKQVFDYSAATFVDEYGAVRVVERYGLSGAEGD